MRILMCLEDEVYMEKLAGIIRELPCHEKVYIDSFSDVKGVDYRLRYEEYDMAFIENRVHRESGTELGKRMNERLPECIIFYVGDDLEYMHEVFIVKGFQLIVKGVDDHNIENEFERALEVYKQKTIQIPFLNLNFEKYSFIPSEIIYIETGSVPTKVMTTHGAFYGEFKDLSEVKLTLTRYEFFQVHQNFFVNLDYIDCIKLGEVGLKNGEWIPTSVLDKKTVSAAIQQFVYRY